MAKATITCKYCGEVGRVHGYQKTYYLQSHYKNSHPDIYERVKFIADNIAIELENIADYGYPVPRLHDIRVLSTEYRRDEKDE